MTTEIALVSIILENGEDMVLEAYEDFDEASERSQELNRLTGSLNYFCQYIELHKGKTK